MGRMIRSRRELARALHMILSMNNPTKLHTVLFFGSHPDLDNDDCWAGADYATYAEALAVYNAPAAHLPKLAQHMRDTEWIMLDSLEGPLLRKNPGFRPSRRDDSAALSEMAMQAGMAFGCDGYNDAMGW